MAEKKRGAGGRRRKAGPPVTASTKFASTRTARGRTGAKQSTTEEAQKPRDPWTTAAEGLYGIQGTFEALWGQGAIAAEKPAWV